MSKLTWEIIGTSLQLTVKDGSKTSVWTLRKSASGAALGATLRAVQEALVPQVGSASKRPSTARSVASKLEDAKPVGWYDQDRNFHEYEAPEEPLENSENLTAQEALEREIYGKTELENAISEGRSLEQLKELAWKLAQRGAGFVRGEVPDDLARQVNAQPEYRQKGVNPGFPTFGVNPVENKKYREKPQYNIDNHED